MTIGSGRLEAGEVLWSIGLCTSGAEDIEKRLS